MNIKTAKPASEEISLVSACAATTCKFNQQAHCTAGQIKLVLLDGKPGCGTFTANSGK